MFFTAKPTIGHFCSFAYKNCNKNLFKTVFRIKIFCKEAVENRFHKEQLTWYTLYVSLDKGDTFQSLTRPSFSNHFMVARETKASFPRARH